MFTVEEKKILLKLGNKIRALREEKLLSQFQLAMEADIPKNQVGRIERAEINTTILTLSNIAKALNVDVKDFLL
ncbi:XRE family transcriptional regulator [Arenibacter sp. TNZ]|uniref:helix-turn-helix domain-containing protein n=1 Tax=Arenibacter TaxID=178469 RepID=UPI000CD4818C|nr:helix-turn-helix transcriptional regulator [Arenibacter catalasegens]MCM4172464.1 XRE family transcriptional regulator [Arenibacter sp. TNZ]